MKVLEEYGKYRLVETLGQFMETRYEIQELYSYYAHKNDTERTYAWHMACWSHDLERAKQMYYIRTKI
jgi:hypothetical protein